VQPRIPLALFAIKAHGWLLLNLVSTRTPKCFSAKLRPQLGGPQHISVHGVPPPQVQDSALLLELHEVDFMRFQLLMILFFCFLSNFFPIILRSEFQVLKHFVIDRYTKRMYILTSKYMQFHSR